MKITLTDRCELTEENPNVHIFFKSRSQFNWNFCQRYITFQTQSNIFQQRPTIEISLILEITFC